jgi:hypothetical protein
MRFEPADGRERGGGACGDVVASRRVRIGDEQEGGDTSNLIGLNDDGKCVGAWNDRASNFRAC